MKNYLIKYINNQISTYEIISTDIDIMMYQGEEKQKYNHNAFWEWFKRKIEYEDEALSFVMIYDKELTIDDSIKISTNHHLSSDEILDLIYEFKSSGLMVKTFPNVDLDIKIEYKKQIIPPLTNKKTATPKKKSLQKYFKNQTARHKG